MARKLVKGTVIGTRLRGHIGEGTQDRRRRNHNEKGGDTMEILAVKGICLVLKNIANDLKDLIEEMETKVIVGEINRPPVVKVKKERKKKVPAPVKVELPSPKVEVKTPRKRRTKKEMAEAKSVPEIPPNSKSSFYDKDER